MNEASIGLLIGAWIVFIATRRPFRQNEPSRKPQSCLMPEASGLEADADTWNCDLPLIDGSAADKADRWILS